MTVDTTCCSKILLLLTLGFGFLIPGTALGNDSAKKAPKKSESKTAKSKTAKPKTAKSKSTKVKKAKSYDFSADEIDGDRVRPDGTSIFGIKGAKHASLIRLREHFIFEIVKSAEML